MKSKTHECPYKQGNRDVCVHKFGVKVSSKRRRCGFKDCNDCPLFLEWVEISTLCKEKSKIIPINPLKNNTTEIT